MEIRSLILIIVMSHSHLLSQIPFDSVFYSNAVVFGGDTLLIIREDLDYKLAFKQRRFLDALSLAHQEKYAKAGFDLELTKSEILAIIGDCDSSYQILKTYFKNPNKQTEIVFTNQRFLNCQNHDNYMKLKEGYINTHLSPHILYPQFASDLWTMSVKDQAFIELIESHTYLPEDGSSAAIDSFVGLKREFQFENEKQLLGIVESIGWPTINKVGRSASVAAFLIVQHSDNLELQRQVLDSIYIYALQNEISPYDYAYLFDRVSIRSGEKQHFGTQVLKSDDGAFRLAPCIEVPEVLINRTKLGLDDWNTYLSRYNIRLEY